MAFEGQVNPLVSVVIPVYNASPFVEQGYEQVNRQDYKHLEIIFIDNNSSDDTVSLIQNLAKSDKRIRLIHESKQGAGAARNTGMRHANSEIISFFDIDDLVESDKISGHVRILRENPGVDLVFGKMKKWYPDSNYSYIISENVFKPGVIQPYNEAIVWIKQFGNLPGIPACTCHREAALLVGGFEESLRRGEDAAFLIKMALNGTMYFEDRIVGTYVRHSGSTVSVSNTEKGNPYYIQHKTFFLPYLISFSQSVSNQRVARLASQITLYSLNAHLHKLSKYPGHRVKLSIAEVIDLISKGYPKIVALCSVLLALVPLGVSKFLLKIYAKCFYIKKI